MSDFGNLLKNIYQMNLTGNPIEENINWSLKASSKGASRSFGDYLITRGSVSNYSDFHRHVSDIFTENLAERKTGFQAVHSNNKFLGTYEKSATLVSNLAVPIEYRKEQILHHLYDKAGALYSQGAFLHHYNRFGTTNNDILLALAKFKSLLNIGLGGFHQKQICIIYRNYFIKNFRIFFILFLLL